MTTLAEYEAREERARELIPIVEQRIANLEGAVVDAVKVGAELGEHLQELAKRHKDDAGTWLLSMCPNIRVADFAMRSAKAMRRNPALDDTSQLTFALLTDPQVAGSAPPKSQGIDPSDILKYAGRITVLLSKWGTDDVKAWPSHRRDMFIDAMSPLVELFKRVQGVDSHG
jgi:hypothetical protein